MATVRVRFKAPTTMIMLTDVMTRTMSKAKPDWDDEVDGEIFMTIQVDEVWL